MDRNEAIRLLETLEQLTFIRVRGRLQQRLKWQHNSLPDCHAHRHAFS